MAASAFLLAGLSLSHMWHGVTAAPPPPAPAPATAPRKLHGRFLHITGEQSLPWNHLVSTLLTTSILPPDFHPDEFYKVHSSTSADYACHSGRGVAGTYGAETSDCDTPISLVNATFDWVAQNLRDNIDFVVWTGDSARHDSDESIPRSPAQVLGTNRLLADKFADTFSVPSGLSIPIVPNFGNNDILPHNILLPGPNKWLSYYADIWSKFIPEEQRHSFEFGGWFYVEVIPNKLAVFSLNTLYLFDRNAAVDDCAKPSEPGFKQLEWLRVQLQFMRVRGMKAILMGHVPPARTDSKVLWDETCWQKYTLWLQQYRDVVVSGLYGHMNIDHFMLLDTEETTIEPAGSQSSREFLGDELSIQSATDYLAELRDNWAKLPKPSVSSGSDVEFESDKKSNKKKGKKDKKKKNKDKNKKKSGGKWAERYQLALVSPSIVPNYFPTLRVFEYNITGLEDAVPWADYHDRLPMVDEPDLDTLPTDDVQDPLVDASPSEDAQLELRSVSDSDVEADKKKKGKKDKKKKKKGKGGGKSKDPNLVVPKPPDKSSPPGPAYSPQPLTLMSYTQYFANLTHINNDMVSQSEEDVDDVGSARWRKGKHADKKPQHKDPKPRKFEFEVEYDTRTDKVYNLPDLTVRSFVDLAYRMGRTAKTKSKSEDLSFDDLFDEVHEHKELGVEELKDLKEPSQVVLGDNDESDDESDDDDDDDEDDDEVDTEKKKKKGGKDKKKKKKKKAKKLNKIWLQFLKRAFVGTMNDEEIKETFS